MSVLSKIYDSLKALEVLEEDPPLKQHFLELHRLHLRNHYPDGKISAPYTYETVVRKHLDAVAILLFKGDPRKNPTIFLRKTLRPALAMREYIAKKAQPGILSLQENPILLEVVAGLLEEGDHHNQGILNRAVAEIWEEAGFKIKTHALISLGKAIYPTPGMNPEQIYLFAAPTPDSPPSLPPGDGSTVEEIGGLVTFSLQEALVGCQNGQIRDAKTEICLHRFNQLQQRKS